MENDDRNICIPHPYRKPRYIPGNISIFGGGDKWREGNAEERVNMSETVGRQLGFVLIFDYNLL